ncbi:MAG: YigZ family protein [Flavobacteriaceae bacterium]
MHEKDTYKTIEIPSEEVLYKEKNSKFFGYCFPVQSEEQVKEILEKIKKEHYAARHWCYAFQIGTEQIHYRANDDGEPSGSAGLPIYGQIQSFEVTNILVVVVRYFGGVKLGVGGLVSAYKETAKMALENSEIIEKTIDIRYRIKFGYKDMNRVMRVIKEKNLNVTGQKLEMDCQIEISVRKKDAPMIFSIFEALYEVSIMEY